MSAMPVLYQRFDGWTEWVFPAMRGYRVACCDCGLTCDMQFRVLYKGEPVPANKYRVLYRCRISDRKRAELITGLENWSDWNTVTGGIFLAKCKDCDFIHDMDFRIVKVQSDDHHGGYRYQTIRSPNFTVQMRVRLNKRSTGQVRRYIRRESYAWAG